MLIRVLSLSILAALWTSSLSAQPTWTIRKVDEGTVQMDGRLTEWQSVQPLVLSPDSPQITREGEFDSRDVRLEVRAVWDKEGLYMALQWKDDQWDVLDIPRREAVWITPEGRRRSRMVFYDNLNLELSRRNYNYFAWVSPRADGQGPFSWAKRTGEERLELAGSPPLISVTTDEDGTVSMEWLFRWKELGLKGKRYKDLFFRLQVADGDLPGALPEAKLDAVKTLSLVGRVDFVK
ncbi:MAG TPA: hypothetical protein VLV83_15740 [Acidobacteriota bacterium]|nr:hypothetical protein [Acidobacteriota bacterium]